MTDDINRLLDEYRDACVAYKENCDALSVATEARKWRDAARAAILSHFDRRKEGEGGEDARDAARYRWLRDESANSVLGPFVMSAGPGMYGWIEGERTDAQVDAARTEGKGNG